MQEWLTMTAAALGRAIEAGEIDPVALCEVYLTAIEGHAARDDIYARLTRDRALSEAHAARERAQAGLRRGPLDGVPISWKDLFDTAGTGTEAGTQLMSGRVPDADAEVLRRATTNGLICLGKTHLSEIAFSGLGVNPKTATSPNRAGADYAPGGSSSGAAASVAYGLAAAGIGSDTGGSVRVPSAWNDLVGFKTTHGVLPLDGSVPLASGFDTVGPLCRSVEDAALLFAAMGGASVDLTGATVQGMRFGVIETVALDALAPDVAAAFDASVARLERSGATITRFAAPELDDAFSLAGPLYTAEAWAAWGDLIEAQPGTLWHHIEERVCVGADVRASDYIRAWDRLRALRAQWAARTAPFDAVLCPTVPILPPKVADLLADDAYYRDTNLMALRNTRIGNLMGLCGVSLPTGVPGAGLLVNGAAGQDAHLLRVAQAAEHALT